MRTLASSGSSSLAAKTSDAAIRCGAMAGAQCFDARESDVVFCDELPGRNGVFPPGSSTYKIGSCGGHVTVSPHQFHLSRANVKRNFHGVKQE